MSKKTRKPKTQKELDEKLDKILKEPVFYSHTMTWTMRQKPLPKACDKHDWRLTAKLYDKGFWGTLCMMFRLHSKGALFSCPNCGRITTVDYRRLDNEI